MRCPECYSDTKIVDSRKQDYRGRVRRRRECKQCGYRFTTIEEIDIHHIRIIDKGVFRPFSRGEVLEYFLRNGIKIEIATVCVDNVVNRITRSYYPSISKERYERLLNLELQNAQELQIRQLDNDFGRMLAIEEFWKELQLIEN